MGSMLERLTQDQIKSLMMQADPFTWITENNIRLSHGPWRLNDHEYQVAWFQEDALQQVFIKGAQIGATDTQVLKTLHGMIYAKYPQGALYLFPTRDDVGDFSKARFDPLIEQNECIGSFVKSTDAQNIKRIGDAFLYLRGARSTKTIGGTKKSSSQLKSIPVDRIVFDEVDEIDPTMIELAKERVSHSKIKELIYVGTPTIPDYGVDKYYQNSDQRVWQIKCHHCGKWSCLDLEFPQCLKYRKDGTVYRACIYCGKEVYPKFGEWVAQYPNKSKDLVGWWISQLNSIYIDPTYILDLYENPPNGNLSEVMNSKLGRAYIPAENRLTHNEVYSCCGKDPMLNTHEGPCAMGVDVGKELNVVIGYKITRKSLKVIKIGRYEHFSDLHDLIKKFNVGCVVIDLFPEKRKVVELQKTESTQIFGCNYIESQVGHIAWDEKERIVKGNRTEICDMSHDLVAIPGQLELPRRSTEIDKFVKEVCNIAKVLEEDPITGSKVYRYKKLGPDHYRHALGYMLLASERISSVSERKLISRFWNNRKRRSWKTI